MKPAVLRQRLHVALLVETSLGSGRDILRGIARYVREHESWALFHEPRSLEDSVPQWLEGWRGDGIIARIQNRKMAEAVLATGLPAVDVLGMVPETGIPLVHVDDRQIGRLAAAHLIERGFQHFGYFGITDENWSIRRREAFRTCLREHEFNLDAFDLPRHVRRTVTWEQRENRLARWIQTLPKPVGVMVCSDQRGLDFLEACRRAQVGVPDEVAVIGVDNDDALCEVANPPLSSIWPAHNQVGYEAAALLAQFIHGGLRPASPILIAPGGIITRQSTDVLAIPDRNLALALKIIRERAWDGLKVDAVARYAGLSRSVLQRRFRKVLGRTVHEEMLNARLRHACGLLSGTRLALAEVAERSGFKHQEYLGAVFKRRLGMTPAQYRRQAGPLAGR
ncbi:MAG TPA: DNA-binding transcriptional regulator [Candidatus Paceibacterota bacterium]|nr:DNA-binding transcriptional regulator [Candidatus Paceibacterota bacterium]